MYPTTPPSCGREPIGRRACRWNARRSKASRPLLAPHRRMRCRIMTLLRKCCSTVFRPGRTFSTGCGLKISARPAYRAKRRSAISGPRRADKQFDFIRLVGRYRGPGLGHRSRARRHAHLQDHARKPPGLLHSFRRSHLRRLSGALRAETAERGNLAQHRDRGEIRRRAQPRAVSRQLQIQSARRQFARLQCRGADAGAVGRP